MNRHCVTSLRTYPTLVVVTTTINKIAQKDTRLLWGLEGLNVEGVDIVEVSPSYAQVMGVENKLPKSLRG